MPVNDTTANRSYQKPNIANTLSDDVGRLRSALDAIDTDMASKAPSAGPTFTGVTTVAAGSAAAPSLTFTGATSDTGLYSPAADHVAISTGGTGRVFVDASGNVSIGTTSTSGFGRGVSVNGTTYSYYDVYADGAIYGRVRAYLNEMALLAQGVSSYLILGTNNTERARITSDGNVGIGTSAPQARLEVGGSGQLYINQDQRLQWNVAGSTTIRADIRGTSSNELVFGNRIGGVLTDSMIIDGSGKVGIGTSSPTNSLEVVGGATTNLFAVKASSGGDCLAATARTAGNGGTLSALNNAQSDYEPLELNGEFIYFQTRTGAGTVAERARLDSSGRLLVGTSTSTGEGVRLQVEATDAAAGIQIRRNSNDGSAPSISFQKSRGTANGSVTSVQSGDKLLQIIAFGADGTSNLQSAEIAAFVDGTPGANDMPGRLVFSTTADGASSPTEAMRINNQRELLIGTTTRTANGGVLQISNGITFPGTQSACSDPNTLDDYEEGTFTPTATPTTSGTITLSGITASYTKVGDTVSVRMFASVSAVSSPLGDIDISLPFTNSGSAAGSVYFYNGGTGAEMANFIGRVSGNVFRIIYGTGQTGASSAPYARANVEIDIAAVYRT